MITGWLALMMMVDIVGGGVVVIRTVGIFY
jgi:hypothetical protein